jgi:flagellar hook-basal body complex protein FliE
MTNAMTLLVQADRARIGVDLASLTQEAAVLPANPALQAANAPASFSDSLKQAVASVDSQERLAADKMAAVDSGKSDYLIGAMLSSQEASLSFSMLTQVRNKVMGAVDELSKLAL